MDINTFIDKVASGNASEAKEVLSDLLSARAFEALDAKKVEMAQTLFGAKEETLETDNTQAE